MPFGDRTGPQGLGPMTGRAAGYCAGYPVPGYMNPAPGRGGWGRGGGWSAGRGRGRGRGFGWRATAWGAPPYWGTPYAPGYGPQEEAAALKDQARYFEEALQDIKQRIEEIESSAEKD